jgi:hypothetical protein
MTVLRKLNKEAHNADITCKILADQRLSDFDN